MACTQNSKEVVPLSTWVLISNFKLSYNLLRRPDGSFNRPLAEFLDRRVTASLVPVDGVASKDFLIDRITGVWGRIFWDITLVHRNANYQRISKIPLILYFHGGSFVHSSASSAIYDAMCRRLVKMCKVVILSVNFRRAPENRYPCAYDDGITSLRWAQSLPGLAILNQLGCDPMQTCFLAGDSSGGNIAHNVMIQATENGLPVAGMVLLMPMFGGQMRTPSEMALDGRFFVTTRDRDWYWRAFLPIGVNRDHPACNPFSQNAPNLRDKSIPPCLLIIGGYDILQDWQLNYAYSLKRLGKSVEVMFLEHATMGFFLLPNTDLFFLLVEKLTEFLHKPR